MTKEADWQHTDISDRSREAEFAMIYTTDSEKEFQIIIKIRKLKNIY